MGGIGAREANKKRPLCAAMRTGFDLMEVEDATPSLRSLLDPRMRALLSVFEEDSLRVAAACAVAEGRRSVSEEDMRRALRYNVRTFLDAEAHPNLEARVEEEMRREEEEEDDEDEEDEGEGEDDEDDEEDDEEEDEHFVDHPLPSFSAALEMKRRVDEACVGFDEWQPEDEVQQLMKRCLCRAEG